MTNAKKPAKTKTKAQPTDFSNAPRSAKKALAGALENASLLTTATKSGFDLQALIALLYALINRNPPPVEPPVVPPGVPIPVPPPGGSVPPIPPSSTPPQHRIARGTAKVTGIQEGIGAKWDDEGNIVQNSVRQWVELDKARVAAICLKGDNAPGVCRIMTDNTSIAEDGYVFGPEDDAWVKDPQPGSVADPSAEPMRLVWEDDTDQIYLAHEYQNYGNSNWIRCSVTPGTGAFIDAPRYVGPRYPDTGRFASITLTYAGQPINRINVGRH